MQAGCPRVSKMTQIRGITGKYTVYEGLNMIIKCREDYCYPNSTFGLIQVHIFALHTRVLHAGLATQHCCRYNQQVQVLHSILGRKGEQLPIGDI